MLQTAVNHVTLAYPVNLQDALGWQNITGNILSVSHRVCRSALSPKSNCEVKVGHIYIVHSALYLKDWKKKDLVRLTLSLKVHINVSTVVVVAIFSLYNVAFGLLMFNWCSHTKNKAVQVTHLARNFHQLLFTQSWERKTITFVYWYITLIRGKGTKKEFYQKKSADYTLFIVYFFYCNILALSE